MAKQRNINKRDFVLGFIIGILLAIILSSVLNAIIFKRIITENRAQRVLIQNLLSD